MLRRGDWVEAVARHLLRTPAVGLFWALRVLRDAVTVAVHDARPDDAVGYLRRVAGRAAAGRRPPAAADRTGPWSTRRPTPRRPLPASPRRSTCRPTPQPGAYRPSPSAQRWQAAARSVPPWRYAAAGPEGRLSDHPGLTRTRADRRRAAVRRGPGDPAGGYRSLCETGENSWNWWAPPTGPARAVRGDGRADLGRGGDAPRTGPAARSPPTRSPNPLPAGHGRRGRPVGRRTRRGRTARGARPAGQHPALLHPMHSAPQHLRGHRRGPRRPRPAARHRRRGGARHRPAPGPPTGTPTR